MVLGTRDHTTNELIRWRYLILEISLDHSIFKILALAFTRISTNTYTLDDPQDHHITFCSGFKPCPVSVGYGHLFMGSTHSSRGGLLVFSYRENLSRDSVIDGALVLF